MEILAEDQVQQNHLKSSYAKWRYYQSHLDNMRQLQQLGEWSAMKDNYKLYN
jgi:hypothetical protein